MSDICRWKGTAVEGKIICGGKNNNITTDDRVVTCRECLLKMKGNRGGKHIHLNANFLQFASLNKKDILSFQPYTHTEKLQTICRRDAERHFPSSRITNDPKEITCTPCLTFWGRKETKKFVLQGIMIEGGHDMRFIRRKLSVASNEKLKKMLDRLLYGDKVYVGDNNTTEI